jgi:nucleoside-diphosphate-sugar epimerase
MRVLLLGGTGAIGIELLKLLQNLHYDVYYTSRRKINNDQSIYHGDAKDLGFLKFILSEKWDVIVDFMVYSTEEFNNRVNLLLKYTGHYLFISSSRVYSDNSINPITPNSKRLLDSIKDSDYLKTDEYALSKARQENILFQSKYENFSILRPYITFNSNRLQLLNLEKEYWLSRAIKKRPVVIYKESLDTITTMTSSDDVAALIERIIKLGPQKKAYNLASNQSLPWSEVLLTYSKIIYDTLGISLKMHVISLDDYYDKFGFSYQIKYDRLFHRVFSLDKNFEGFQFSNTKENLLQKTEKFLLRPNFQFVDHSYNGVSDYLSKSQTDYNEITGIKNKLVYYYNRFIKHR